MVPAKHVFSLSVFPSTVMTEVLSPAHLTVPGDSVYVAWYERAGNTLNTPGWPSNGTVYTETNSVKKITTLKATKLSASFCRAIISLANCFVLTSYLARKSRG